MTIYIPVSVEKELPSELTGDVIAITNYRIKYKAIYIKGVWNHYPFNYIDEEITHWLKPVEISDLITYVQEGIADQRKDIEEIVKQRINSFFNK